MSRTIYKSLEEVPQVILDAYREGRYTFSAPPVCTARWTALDWINCVTFPADVDPPEAKSFFLADS